MTDVTHLLLADHNTLLRSCLAAVLNRRNGLQVVGEAETGSQAITQVRTLQPDIVLLDPEMPESGPELIGELRKGSPDCGVLVLAQGRSDFAKDVFLAGARGYLMKDCAPDDVVRAIKLVQSGELVVAPGISETVVDSLSGKPVPDSIPDSLTERERQVLQLVVRGLTNRQIADELFITEHTAKGHLGKILDKTGVDNRIQLAIYAVQRGLAAAPEAEAADGADFK